jgi:hypothetical protein
VSREQESRAPENQGVSATELSDEELERQGLRAHATRHWVFLHGTAEQFQTHTLRMLGLEEEYLRRHPRRTWQGSGGTDSRQPTTSAGIARIRDLVDLLRSELADLADPGQSLEGEHLDGPGDLTYDPLVWTNVLARFAEAPGGRIHKLEAHQLARQLAPNARVVAALYRNDPPLLAVDGDYRTLTEAGRSWLAAQASG